MTIDEIEKMLDFADAEAIPAVGVDVARILLNRIKELDKAIDSLKQESINYCGCGHALKDHGGYETSPKLDYPCSKCACIWRARI